MHIVTQRQPSFSEALKRQKKYTGLSLEKIQ